MSDEHTFEDFERNSLFNILSETERFANVGGWEWDISKDVWTFSDSWLRIHGCSKRHLTMSELLPIAHHDDRQHIQKTFDRVVSEGASYEIEHRIIRQDTGEKRYVRNLGRAKLDGDGKAVKLYGSAQDITEHKRADESLRESEDRFKHMVNEAPLGIAIVDSLNAKFYLVNLALARITGRSMEELERIDWESITHPDDIQPDKDNMAAMNAGKIPGFQMEKRYLRTDGKYFWVNITVAPMYVADKSKPRHLLMVEDITERKQAQEALRESEEKYRLLVKHANDAIFIAQDNIIKFPNPKTIEMLGYSENELSEIPFVNLIHPEDSEMVAKRHVQRLTGEQPPQSYSFRVINKVGNQLWVQINAARISWEGRPATINMLRDITEHKRAEEALKASEKKYQSLFNNAQVALFRNRLSDGKVLEINERYAKMAGYLNIEDCIAEFNAADAWVDPNGRKELLRILQENGFVSDYETEIIRRDGTNIWISFSATLFPEQGYVEGSIVEITERKRSEIERRKLQAQLSQAQKMESVGRLAGGVAHDFNNMLSVILGRTEMALEDIDPNQTLYADLVEIQTAAKRSADVTRQLLAFARKQTIAPKVVNLNSTIESTLKMLRRLIGEDIDLIWLPNEDLWPVRIDSSQVDQILANLCVNARDAIADVGKLTIETGKATFDETYCAVHSGFVPGDFVQLTVSDNGCGMNQETLQNLFEPFYTTKDVGSGTGLGLATVYGIVKQNNGFINVYSEPGQGTTFRIYLPRHLAETEILEIKPSDTINPDGTETILLVEDEPSILQMAQTMLERMGYEVLAAGTPGEAIALAREHAGEIHLLMTDVVMPEMNGRDLARNMLSLYPNLKRLFMSGYTANVIAHHGVLDEGVQFIQKPFSKQDLAIKVREALDEDNL